MLIILGSVSKTWSQGFIEMPDTTEVPSFEESSRLLDLDIPPVSERDPDPLGGPRLNVTEFRLQGLVDYPELGITRKALIAYVESVRASMMRHDELGKWGYTEEEISEIADLMGDIEDDIQDSHVANVEVQRLVFLIREQRRKRGVTLGMIENVADVITQFYRERGFILAKAYIPEQKVRDGVVTLTLLLGELGDVKVYNAKRASEGLIKRAFKPYLNEPVTSQRLEEALYLVNDIPGLSARSVLSPGLQVGDTLLSVNTQDEKWFSGNVRVDNYGSRSTSKNRLYGDFYVHNPSGLGDDLYFAILKTYNPDSSTFGAFRYSSFWGHPRLRTSVGYSINDFVSARRVGDAQVPEFTGESEVADISLRYIFKRLRVKNLSAEIKYSSIDTLLDVGGENDGHVDKLSIGFNFDLLNEKRRHLYLGNISLHAAQSTTDELFGLIERDELFLTYDFSMLLFMNIPFTKKETRLLINSAGQYSPDSLSNVDQINLTGVGRARTFSINGFQADSGIYLGADWLFSLPKFERTRFFGEPYHSVFQPYLFFDISSGIRNELGEDELDESTNGTLAGAGLGLRLKYRKINANVSVSGVIIDDVSGLQQSTDTSTMNIELSYSF